jgi:hypothetical protein
MNTSLDYGELYRPLHEKSGGKYFPGRARHGLQDLIDLVNATKASRILDYGSGKGFQYLVGRMHEQWDSQVLPHCYDVGVRQLSNRPPGKFSGVICTDMMEHIAEADVDAILADVFAFIEVPSGEAPTAFAYFHIACRPSGGGKHKKLGDGRDVHLTIEPPRWWDAELARFARPGLAIKAHYDIGE